MYCHLMIQTACKHSPAELIEMKIDSLSGKLNHLKALIPNDYSSNETYDNHIKTLLWSA